MLNAEQRAEVAAVFHEAKGAGFLDYVTCWYRKASDYMAENTAIRAAFVSTNSITQGEQVGILWPDLFRRGVKLHYAHRTFQWNSEVRGKAAVHCVIIGFGMQEAAEKWLFDYDTPNSVPHVIKANNINPYLVDGPDVIAFARIQPICDVPAICNGSIPADGGNLILEPSEKTALVSLEPQVAKYIRPYLGADGFINNIIRYCLWLTDCLPEELKAMPNVMARVKAVQQMRLTSSKAATREKAKTPTLFTENRQPLSGSYLALPRTSSENRYYLPIGFLSADIIAANDLQFIPNAMPYHFGVITSAMHMAWMRITSGRLESRYCYSVKCTYNNFPWPEPTDKQQTAIEAAAQAILDARAKFMNSPFDSAQGAGSVGERSRTATLADLYDPLTMPPELVKAHQALDRTVDVAYGKTGFKTEAERVAFLFERYQGLTAPLGLVEKTGKRGGKKVAKIEALTEY
jgi:hypothetical protein